jgi:hypothetical protein
LKGPGRRLVGAAELPADKERTLVFITTDNGMASLVWPHMVSRHGSSWVHGNPHGTAKPPRGLCAAAGAALSARRNETNKSSFSDLCEIRGWGCLANFTREEGPFWLTSRGTCPCRRPGAYSRVSGLPRACTHESAFCKRSSLNVRFAPKATEVLRCRELTRCANRRPEQVQQI